MEQMKITLVRSLIGAKPNQKATAASLGLKKIGDSFVGAKNAANEGKAVTIRHLVKVETVSSEI